jgi:hypothetical protein
MNAEYNFILNADADADSNSSVLRGMAVCRRHGLTN